MTGSPCPSIRKVTWTPQIIIWRTPDAPFDGANIVQIKVYAFLIKGGWRKYLCSVGPVPGVQPRRRLSIRLGDEDGLVEMGKAFHVGKASLAADAVLGLEPTDSAVVCEFPEHIHHVCNTKHLRIQGADLVEDWDAGDAAGGVTAVLVDSSIGGRKSESPSW